MRIPTGELGPSVGIAVGDNCGALRVPPRLSVRGSLCSINGPRMPTKHQKQVIQVQATTSVRATSAHHTARLRGAEAY